MTRNRWLTDMMKALRPWFREVGFPLPAGLWVSCSWKRPRALHPLEVPVSLCIESGPAAAGVLLHELIHKAVGQECGHRGAFAVCSERLGLEGPWTGTKRGFTTHATLSGALMAERLRALFPAAYPAASVDLPKLAGSCKQSTRLVKSECPACGYVTRTARKWLDTGTPLCPCNHLPMVVEGAPQPIRLAA